MKTKMIFLNVLFAAFSAFSTEYFVDASRPNDTGGATSWATAKKTIQAAVDLTVNGDTVWVTNGVYDIGGKVTPGYSLTNRVCITKAITVQSANGPEVTIIKGAAGSNGSNDVDSIRGVFMQNGCSLVGFTITSGYTAADGHRSFDCSGGGVFIMTNCVVGSCVLDQNQATDEGGGAQLYYGGVLNNCLLTRNFSSGWGGGVEFYFGGTMNNCVVSDNETGLRNGTSGGIMMTQGGTVNNSILWGNTDNVFSSKGFIPNLHYTCSSDGVTHGSNGCITNNPLFMDVANGDFRLQSNSPCINAGNNTDASAGTDLADNPRIAGGTVDMGAYEFYENLNDVDGDGLPNWWEKLHFGGVTNASKDAVCPNGVNSILQAYVAGLDPNDPGSKFQTSVLRSLTSGNELQWQGVSGRVYAVYYSTNLVSGFQPLETNIPWSAGCFTDAVHHANGQLFYKLEVRLDDSDGSGGGDSAEQPFFPPGGDVPPGAPVTLI